jgi:hypothetical protein
VLEREVTVEKRQPQTEHVHTNTQRQLATPTSAQINIFSYAHAYFAAIAYIMVPPATHFETHSCEADHRVKRGIETR